jgi:hypothetical protein
MLKISDVKKYEFNVKNHSDKQIDLLAKIIKRIGWRQSVEVNQKGSIIAGHGRWLVWEKYKDDPDMPPIWIIDDMGNTIHGEHATKALTDEEEKMWRIADNKVSELGDWNLENFNIEFTDLSKEFKDLTGFNDFEVNANDPDLEWEGMPEVNKEKIAGAFKSVIVHFETKDDYQLFIDTIGQDLTDNTKFLWFPKKQKDKLKDFAFVNTEDKEE